MRPKWADLKQRARDHLSRGGTLGSVLLAVGVGLAGGLGALGFRLLIKYGRHYMFDIWAALAPYDLAVIALPAIGMVLTVVLVQRYAKEASGHGVPEVMFAVRRGGGRIRPRIVVIKALASAICIGSGGSVGREGPIVQIGSAVGSSIAQALRLRDDQVKLLLTCGAAAGIGGTFNAPIAGAIFALEVVLGGFTGRSFGLVVVSSVTATALVQAVLGPSPGFPLHGAFQLNSPFELILYALLGVVTGGVAVLYEKSVHGIHDFMERWPVHYIVRGVIGGLIMGLIGWIGLRFLGGPWLFGVGYDGIEHVLAIGRGDVPVPELKVLIFLSLGLLKILATSTTLGAGGSGGVFAPALFIGAMVGAAYGFGVHALFPAHTAPAGAYAVVAMAAVFAGAARAPMTSILILFEMTDNYRIILPLMFTVVIAYMVSSGLSQDSIYSVKLRRLGGFKKPAAPYRSALELILVADSMDQNPITVVPDQPLRDLMPLLRDEGIHTVPVVDDEKLVGLVTRMEIHRAMLAGDAQTLTVKDIMLREPLTCETRESLYALLQRIGDRDIEAVPVIEPKTRKLLGLVSHAHILWAHEEMLHEHEALVARAANASGVHDKHAVQILFEVHANHTQLAFQHIRQLEMPKRARIALVRRGNHTVVPRGSTRLDPGDVLVIIAPPSDEAAVRAWLAEIEHAPAAG